MSSLSDLLAPSLQIGSTILNVGSKLAKSSATRAIGERKKALSEYEAAQLEQNAAAARSVGMLSAEDEQRKTQIINSAALARAAASGAGASDPTVVHILANNAGVGAYRAAVAMYQGESQARLDRMRALAAQFEGKTAQTDAGASAAQSDMTAVSTLLAGGLKTASMFEKYWAGPQIKDRA